MNAIKDEKAQARKAAFARRKLAHEQGHKLDLSAVLALASPHDVVALYMPIRTEICPLEAMERLHEQGKRVCIPVIRAKDTPLIFAKWSPNMALVDGEFGAAIPENVEEVIPTLILAPLVAFDDNGTRLGYGGGFYDRTLERLSCDYFALAYSAQRSEEILPSEPTDLPLMGVITELGLKRF